MTGKVVGGKKVGSKKDTTWDVYYKGDYMVQLVELRAALGFS